MIFNGYVTAVISCLAGIGAFVVTVLLFMAYAWGVLWLREHKAKQTEPMTMKDYVLRYPPQDIYTKAAQYLIEEFSVKR